MYSKVSTEFWGKKFSLETGEIARQANGSVIARYGDNIVVVTVVADENQKEAGGDFLPLTVNYQEKFYASGKIPGGFFKREGRPTEIETLNSRLIDRPLRPLFPKGWNFETQIMATVISSDTEQHLGMISLNAASAALEISDIPFQGPVSAVLVGKIDGKFIVNPRKAELESSELELVVSGNREGILMVEGGARFVPEDELLEAIFFAHKEMQPLLDLQDELREKAGKPKREFSPLKIEPELKKLISELVEKELKSALFIPNKGERRRRISGLKEQTISKLIETHPELLQKKRELNFALEELEAELIRACLKETGKRIDGRTPEEIRPIRCEVGVLPRAHGSVLFTRGETQALVVVTLGTKEDERKIEHVDEEFYKSFYLHYNFLPFSTGETSARLAPGRREIGHGALAERALVRVLPPHTDFPYTIRVVSDILESNGSSSMATVCGGSLALMDAGVPIKEQVAGIAMGLIKETEDNFYILTDILGDEDHAGDMDFKVAGTKDGVTAFQMDLKISSISKQILEKALKQAREARLKILEIMNAVLACPRSELSPYAPRIVTIQVPVDKIREIIGPGGKVIRGIIEQTGATIDIEDDGTVRIASVNEESNEKAFQMIMELIQEVEVGKVYRGKVKKILDFGALVEILPGATGLLHISQISHQRIKEVRDVLKEGDEIDVKVIGLEDNGRIALSRKAILQHPEHSSRFPLNNREKKGFYTRRPDK